MGDWQKFEYDFSVLKNRIFFCGIFCVVYKYVLWFFTVIALLAFFSVIVRFASFVVIARLDRAI